jgi:twitching motility protein PilI
MAEREALRDFQRRLADRLQAAPTLGVQAAWLAVEAAGGRYLIPLAQAGEIFPAVDALTVPHTQPWFLGVVSLRGGLYGVVDLAIWLAAPPQGLPRPRASSPQAQLITFNPALEVQCALRVDRLVGLRGPEHFCGSTPPPEAGPNGLGPVLHEASGRPWQALDLQAWSRQPQFLRIGV